MRAHIFGGAVLVGLLAATACSAPLEGVAENESDHTQGQVIWRNDPHQWSLIERGEFDRRRKTRTIPSDHAISKRLQYWLDLYDDRVRSLVRRQTGTELVAPHPQIRVTTDDELDARVLFAYACITPKPATPRGDDPEVLFLSGRNEAESYAAPDDCYDVENWPSSSGVPWFNALGGLRVEPSDSDVAALDGSGATVLIGQRAAIRTLSPFIQVTSAMVANLSETSIAVILAHELGHYYRAHYTPSVEAHYDFWFDRERHLPERPEPVPNQEGLREDYERLKLPRLLIPGQTFHPRVADTLLRWMDEMVIAPGHVCEAAVSQLGGLAPNVRQELLTQDDKEPIGGDSRAALLSLEPAMKTCIDGLALTNAEVTAGAALTFEGTKAPRAWFEQRISESLRPELAPGTLSVSTTLRTMVDALETAGRRLDDKAPEFVKRLADNRIGLYTPEQEADDLALELSTSVGITPDDVIGGMSEMMLAFERQDPERFRQQQGISGSACASLVASHFRQDGRDVYVPLGSLGDPHHAICYRLFNLQREQEAHGYRVSTTAGRPTSPSWDEIQKLAKPLGAR